MTGGLDGDLVFERVRACLDNLVAGSGHLASYALRRPTFEVTARRATDGGDTAYEFAVEGVAITEFTGIVTDADAGSPCDDPTADSGEAPEPSDEPADEPADDPWDPIAAVDPGPDADPGPERLRGTIVLDETGALVLDDEGQVRIEPWRTLDPDRWAGDVPFAADRAPDDDP